MITNWSHPSKVLIWLFAWLAIGAWVASPRSLSLVRADDDNRQSEEDGESDDANHEERESESDEADSEDEQESISDVREGDDDHHGEESERAGEDEANEKDADEHDADDADDADERDADEHDCDDDHDDADEDDDDHEVEYGVSADSGDGEGGDGEGERAGVGLLEAMSRVRSLLDEGKIDEAKEALESATGIAESIVSRLAEQQQELSEALARAGDGNAHAENQESDPLSMLDVESLKSAFAEARQEIAESLGKARVGGSIENFANEMEERTQKALNSLSRKESIRQLVRDAKQRARQALANASQDRKVAKALRENGVSQRLEEMFDQLRIEDTIENALEGVEQNLDQVFDQMRSANRVDEMVDDFMDRLDGWLSDEVADAKDTEKVNEDWLSSEIQSAQEQTERECLEAAERTASIEGIGQAFEQALAQCESAFERVEALDRLEESLRVSAEQSPNEAGLRDTQVVQELRNATDDLRRSLMEILNPENARRAVEEQLKQPGMEELKRVFDDGRVNEAISKSLEKVRERVRQLVEQAQKAAEEKMHSEQSQSEGHEMNDDDHGGGDHEDHEDDHHEDDDAN